VKDIAEIRKLPIPERLQLVGQIWDSILDDPALLPVPINSPESSSYASRSTAPIPTAVKRGNRRIAKSSEQRDTKSRNPTRRRRRGRPPEGRVFSSFAAFGGVP